MRGRERAHDGERAVLLALEHRRRPGELHAHAEDLGAESPEVDVGARAVHPEDDVSVRVDDAEPDQLHAALREQVEAVELDAAGERFVGGAEQPRQDERAPQVGRDHHERERERDAHRRDEAEREGTQGSERTLRGLPPFFA